MAVYPRKMSKAPETTNQNSSSAKYTGKRNDLRSFEAYFIGEDSTPDTDQYVKWIWLYLFGCVLRLGASQRPSIVNETSAYEYPAQRLGPFSDHRHDARYLK